MKFPPKREKQQHFTLGKQPSLHCFLSERKKERKKELPFVFETCISHPKEYPDKKEKKKSQEEKDLKKEHN